MFYDYLCESCGTKEERRVPMDDRDAQTCSCGEKLRRLFSMPTIYCRGDANDIPEEKRYRDPRHPKHLSGSQIERRYQKHIDTLRELKAHGRESKDGRLLGSLPNELFWAKRKEDPNYWNDPSNLKKHKEFLI